LGQEIGGLKNETPGISAPGASQGIVGCDALLDRAVANPKIVREIQVAGFVTIRCGDRRKEL
jgi:hypothetical protein